MKKHFILNQDFHCLCNESKCCLALSVILRAGSTGLREGRRGGSARESPESPK